MLNFGCYLLAPALGDIYAIASGFSMSVLLAGFAEAFSTPPYTGFNVGGDAFFVMMTLLNGPVVVFSWDFNRVIRRFHFRGAGVPGGPRRGPGRWIRNRCVLVFWLAARLAALKGTGED